MEFMNAHTKDEILEGDHSSTLMLLIKNRKG